MTLAVAAPLLGALAVVLAAVEIEIEGPYGWAEKLPTPYRLRGPLARLFALVLGGKPLTGYNLLMFAATLLAFHLPYAFGASWTAASELALLAAWVGWSALWDLLWFLLNPAYGRRRFRPGNVWWHRRWLWRLPLDYWVAIVVSLILAGLAQAAGGSGSDASGAGTTAGGPLAAQALLLVAFAAWAVAAGLVSPLYRRLYARTHAAARDERGLALITPPPGDMPPGSLSAGPLPGSPPGSPPNPKAPAPPGEAD